MEVSSAAKELLREGQKKPGRANAEVSKRRARTPFRRSLQIRTPAIHTRAQGARQRQPDPIRLCWAQPEEAHIEQKFPAAVPRDLQHPQVGGTRKTIGTQREAMSSQELARPHVGTPWHPGNGCQGVYDIETPP